MKNGTMFPSPLRGEGQGGGGLRSFMQNLDTSTKKILYGWLTFAVSSLIFAGIFAFLVVMSRTPVIMNLFPRTDYIRTALVGHVILSFVIWFLAFEGLLWTLTSTLLLKRGLFCKHAGWAGLMLSIAGTVLVVITAVAGLGEPKFINYIPVLTHPLFYAGLVLLFSGMTVTLLNTFLTAWKARQEKTYEGRMPLFTFGMLISGTAFLSAVACFALSYYFHILSPLAKVPVNLETLFWGGGHILQFTNTITMVTVWLFLTFIVLKKLPVKESWSKLLFSIYLIFILPGPFVYFLFDTGSAEYTKAFTKLMEYGLGPSTGIFAVAILVAIASSGVRQLPRLPWSKPEFSSLVLSMFLFALGGIISLTIYGYNTKIPAHYHGVIGGVTIAFMGLTNYVFDLLKQESGVENPIPTLTLPLKGREISGMNLPLKGRDFSTEDINSLLNIGERQFQTNSPLPPLLEKTERVRVRGGLSLAMIYPYVYGTGQTFFVIGMFLAGSHGVARKTFGAAQQLDSTGKIVGMAITGFGGFIAIVGGILFIIYAIRRLTQGPEFRSNKLEVRSEAEPHPHPDPLPEGEGA